MGLASFPDWINSIAVASFPDWIESIAVASSPDWIESIAVASFPGLPVVHFYWTVGRPGNEDKFPSFSPFVYSLEEKTTDSYEFFSCVYVVL